MICLQFPHTVLAQVSWYYRARRRDIVCLYWRGNTLVKSVVIFSHCFSQETWPTFGKFLFLTFTTFHITSHILKLLFLTCMIHCAQHGLLTFQRNTTFVVFLCWLIIISDYSRRFCDIVPLNLSDHALHFIHKLSNSYVTDSINVLISFLSLS